MRVVNSMIIEKVVGLDLLAQILKVGPYILSRRFAILSPQAKGSIKDRHPPPPLNEADGRSR